MLSNSTRFISNNVKRIQSFENRIEMFWYLKRLSLLVGTVLSKGDTLHHTWWKKKKNGMTSLRGSCFFDKVKAILVESLLVSKVIRVPKSQIKDKMNPAELQS